MAGGQFADGDLLGRSVEHVSDQISGVNAVDMLGHGPQGSGQPEAPSDDLGDLDRGRRDQPNPLALVKMKLGQSPGAGPDPVRHGLVEDLLAQFFEFGNGVPLDEGQRGSLGFGYVFGIFDTGDPKIGLFPSSTDDVPGGEEVAAPESPGQMEDGGTLHHGVVHVEEGSRDRIGLHLHGHLQSSAGCSRLAGKLGAALEIGGGR